MKLREMKTGLTISALAHAALLLWGLVSFAAMPFEASSKEGMPVDIISDKQFSEMAKGANNGAKDKPPTPLVEKVADAKPVEDAVAKISEKKEVKATKAEPAPPPTASEKPDPKQPKKDPLKDLIADKLRKEDPKKPAQDESKLAQPQQPQQPQPLAKPQPHFDPTKIAALLDKREAMRQVATGEMPSTTPSLGYVNGTAAQLSQSELDALRERLRQCWNPPAGAMDGGRLKVVLRVQFNQDGSVANPPQLVAGTASNFGPAMAESARRAVLTCQPFKMLKPEHYQSWKDIEITFDPSEMFGG